MIPALIAAIPSLIQAGQGIKQQIEAKKLAKNNNRPSYNPTKYVIPPEIAEYVNRKKSQVSNMLPGQSLMENKIDANTSNAAAAIQQSGSSTADIINSIMGINNQANDAKNTLGIQGAQNYVNTQNAVDQALLSSAGYKDRAYDINSGLYDKSFNINSLDPYKERAAAASSLTGAGMQNTYNGIQGLSNIGMLAATNANRGDNTLYSSRTAAPQIKPEGQPGSSFAQTEQAKLGTPSWMTIPNAQPTMAPSAVPLENSTNIYGNNSMITPEMRARLAQIQRLRELGLITN